MSSVQRIAIVGATGYIGGRLVPRLLESGYAVRCLVRSPGKLQDRAWASNSGAEIRRVELSDVAMVARNLEGCRAAFYLVHSMISAGPDYADRSCRPRAEDSACDDIGSHDSRKQVDGIVAHFVHSMDTAHMMLTTNQLEAEGVHHVAMVHDSFGVHAADVDRLNRVLREVFDRHPPGHRVTLFLCLTTRMAGLHKKMPRTDP